MTNNLEKENSQKQDLMSMIKISLSIWTFVIFMFLLYTGNLRFFQ